MRATAEVAPGDSLSCGGGGGHDIVWESVIIIMDVRFRDFLHHDYAQPLASSSSFDTPDQELVISVE